MAYNPTSPARRKLLLAARPSGRAIGPGLPSVWVLTDPHRMPDPEFIANRLPRGWGMIYRHFGAPDRSDVARSLLRICRKRGCTLTIGNDPGLAKAVRADGVHWPEWRAREARKWRGAFDIMTSACHSRLAIKRLNELPIDGILCSVVFPSRSPSAGKPMGAISFRALTRRSLLPLYALGGVNSSTAGRVAGMAGLAMVDGAF